MTRLGYVGAVVLAIAVIGSMASIGLRLLNESSEAIRWTRLAAERCADGKRTDDLRTLFRAVAAADRALRIEPLSPDAHFQRAVALEIIGLSLHAERAYAAYLKVDHSSPRSIDALQRLRKQRIRTESARSFRTADDHLRLAASATGTPQVANVVQQFPQESREFAERYSLANWGHGILKHRDAYAAKELTFAREIGRALSIASGEQSVADAVATIDAALSASDHRTIKTLARAHDVYARRRNPSFSNLAPALVILDEAASAFRPTRSSMRWSVDIERASIALNVTPLEACKTIRRLLEETPIRYEALRARLYLLQSRCTNNPHEAALAAGRAVSMFQALDEARNAKDASEWYAILLYGAGDRDASWRVSRKVFAASDYFWADWLLMGIARQAIDERLWDVARSATDLVIDPPPSIGGQTLRSEARLLRAVAKWKEGDIQAARYDVDQARIAIAVMDTALRDFESHRLNAVDLALQRQADPARWKNLLAASLRHAIASRDQAEICDLILERARSLKKLGKDREAAAEFARAMNFAAQSPVAMASDQLNIWYTGLSTDVYTELVDLLESRKQTADAFDVSERGRGRLLLHRMGYRGVPLTIESVRQALAPSTLVVSFVPLRDRIVIFTLDRQRSYVTRVHITRQELSEQIDTLTKATHADDAWQAAAARMSETLFGSIPVSIAEFETLVVVPDALLDRVPFAALVNPATKRLLIERTAIVIAPSASVYVSLSAMKETGRATALVVADSEQDLLPRLPAARAEAFEIASLYRSESLTGDAARADTFLARMEAVDVLHVGEHTVIDPADPMESRILMTSGAVRVQDLVRKQVRQGLIAVLAGCRTAKRTGDSDINSLALAFIAAGSRATVATLWDVEDVPTRRFSVRLHKLLRSGIPVSQAVRLVQLEMLRSSNASLNDVRSWSAFQVYGSG
jgi:CHAT domain-containing protein